MYISYPRFEGQEKLGQKKHKALQPDGDVLKDKVCDAHCPDQIKKVKAVEVGLREDEAGREKGLSVWLPAQVVSVKRDRMRCNIQTNG